MSDPTELRRILGQVHEHEEYALIFLAQGDHEKADAQLLKAVTILNGLRSAIAAARPAAPEILPPGVGRAFNGVLFTTNV